MSNWESTYQKLLFDVRHTGEDIDGERTGVGTRRKIFSHLHIPSVQKEFPALTMRRVAPRISFWETMMFLRGETDTKFLEDKKIEIWKGNTRREFLDKNPELAHLPEGNMGKGYGYQWRNFGGVDQLQSLFSTLTNNPYDRRAIISAWNVGELTQMALPPCHIDHQYAMRKDGHGGWLLQSLFHMRSVDLVFGLPYNMMSYAFLLQAFANHLSHLRGEEVAAGSMDYVGFDSHIYKNQFDMVDELVTRTIQVPPTLSIHKELKHLDDLLSLDWSDISINNYNALPDVKAKPAMAV